MFTLGIATYDDYDGLYFTVQSARINHPDIKEVVIIDNNPDSNHGKFIKQLSNWEDKEFKINYISYKDKKSTSVRSRLFEYANQDYVIVADSHVLFLPNSISYLKEFYLNDSRPYDFVQGPMMYDDCKTYSTHLDPVWRANFFGIWATKFSEEKYFEIPSMGLGVFSCKKDEWLGFNPLFKGFGGEEGYIHEKYRKKSGRCICLQNFKWLHRFNRPNGIPFPNVLEHRCYNYFVGRFELEMDYMDVANHFATVGLNKNIVQACFNEAHYAFYKRFPEKLLEFN